MNYTSSHLPGDSTRNCFDLPGITDTRRVKTIPREINILRDNYANSCNVRVSRSMLEIWYLSAMKIASTLEPESDWQDILAGEFKKPGIVELERFLEQELTSGKVIFPSRERYLHALNSTPYAKTRVVILGQDPYPTAGHAHGLAFSVERSVSPLPKSLQNIYRELADDLGIVNHSGYLQPWADQGVLLLNTVLTVAQGEAGGHRGRGWEALTDRIIEALNAHPEPLVFLLWGAHARKKGGMIDHERHRVIEAPHPSPLSAYRGFFGSRPFSATNDALVNFGREPVDWRLA